MNLFSARRSIAEAFKGAGTDNAVGEADLILVRLLRFSQSHISAHPEKILTGE